MHIIKMQELIKYCAGLLTGALFLGTEGMAFLETDSKSAKS